MTGAAARARCGLAASGRRGLAGSGGCWYCRAARGRHQVGRTHADPRRGDHHAALDEGTQLAGGFGASAPGRRRGQTTRQSRGRCAEAGRTAGVGGRTDRARRGGVVRARRSGAVRARRGGVVRAHCRPGTVVVRRGRVAGLRCDSVAVRCGSPDRRGQGNGPPDYPGAGRANPDRACRTEAAGAGKAVLPLGIAVMLNSAALLDTSELPGTAAGHRARRGGAGTGGPVAAGDGLHRGLPARLPDRCREVLRPDGAIGLPANRRIRCLLPRGAESACSRTREAGRGALPAHRAQGHRQHGRVGVRRPRNDGAKHPAGAGCRSRSTGHRGSGGGVRGPGDGWSRKAGRRTARYREPGGLGGARTGAAGSATRNRPAVIRPGGTGSAQSGSGLR